MTFWLDAPRSPTRTENGCRGSASEDGAQIQKGKAVKSSVVYVICPKTVAERMDHGLGASSQYKK